jgi:hypothetical protein
MLAREGDWSLGGEKPADDLQRLLKPIDRMSVGQAVRLDVHPLTRADPEDRARLVRSALAILNESARHPARWCPHAMRDLARLITTAASHGRDIGIYAQRLLDHQLPWTRMR